MSSPAIVPPARIGFVGLGKMGQPMVRHLSRAGYRVLAHDLDPEAVRRAREGAGAEAPGSLRAIGESCEAVIAMLPDGNAVRAVTLGKNGTGDCLLAGLSRGKMLVDMSSSSPAGASG